jgi:hypothetical protein
VRRALAEDLATLMAREDLASSTRLRAIGLAGRMVDEDVVVEGLLSLLEPGRWFVTEHRSHSLVQVIGALRRSDAPRIGERLQALHGDLVLLDEESRRQVEARLTGRPVVRPSMSPWSR